MAAKQLDFLDSLIGVVDNGMRVVFSKPKAHRPSPHLNGGETSHGAEEAGLDESTKKLSASLMRVNHVGEVCAQALYQGQALTSRSTEVRERMKHAADEEIDHLNWCAQRIEELDGKPSVFNPLWYAGSFALGVGAGIAGDKWSLGFLAETEYQVVDHLKSHLHRLPEDDHLSRSIIEQMIIDEEEHAQMAEENGAAELPTWVKTAMRGSAKVMTQISEKL